MPELMMISICFSTFQRLLVLLRSAQIVIDLSFYAAHSKVRRLWQTLEQSVCRHCRGTRTILSETKLLDISVLKLLLWFYVLSAACPRQSHVEDIWKPRSKNDTSLTLVSYTHSSVFSGLLLYAASVAVEIEIGWLCRQGTQLQTATLGMLRWRSLSSKTLRGRLPMQTAFLCSKTVRDVQQKRVCRRTYRPSRSASVQNWHWESRTLVLRPTNRCAHLVWNSDTCLSPWQHLNDSSRRKI